jgi:integrase
MEKPFFSGPFAPLCEIFVKQKQAAGLKYHQQAKILKQFDNFSKSYSIKNYTITEELALAWCRKRPNESDNYRYSRAGEMQRFSEFLAKQGNPSYLLPDRPRKGPRHIPYIFTMDEMKLIFQRLDSLESTNLAPIRHIALPLLFRMLYGCGLRISEAVELKKHDVDPEKGILQIRHGKNDRERLVPMSSSLHEMCIGYLREAHRDTPDDMPFFYTRTRKAHNELHISTMFRGFLWDAGIPYRGKEFGPRLHDLRHTFICQNIRRWAEQGIPIKSMLPALSKYVGHSSVDATQWYLRMTSETFPHLRETCERELGGIYASIPGFKMEDVCDE